MKKILFYLAISLFSRVILFSQNVEYAQATIDTLTSPYFEGRGYVNNGDLRAAKYIASEYKKFGATPFFETGYFHPFVLSVNTFPENVGIYDQNLMPGKDYIVSPDCPSAFYESFLPVFLTNDILTNKRLFKSFLKTNWHEKILVIDTIEKTESNKLLLSKILSKYPYTIHIEIVKDLTWSVSRTKSSTGIFYVLPGKIDRKNELSIKVNAKFIQAYESQNVVGKIIGSEVPDSFVFITGHYDHLGRMGQNTYMPGANDNASGIAMLLDMMHNYSVNKPRYTVVFIAFGAEEAGLVGSYYFVKELQDFINKDKIRFVINMDLMGTGQEGIMAVNGSVYEKEFVMLDSINKNNQYLPAVKKRGKAANSDHYFFSENGIPAFFFYLMGPYAYYHEVDDNSENLRLEQKSYDGSFMLINDFTRWLMHQSH